MKTHGYCDWEDVTVAAAAAGRVQDVREHVAQCAVCEESRQVVEYLHGVAQTLGQEPLRSAGAIWWRHQIEEARRAVDVVVEPIALYQKAAPFIGLVLTAGALLVYPGAAAATGSGIMLSMSTLGLLAAAIVALQCSAFAGLYFIKRR